MTTAQAAGSAGVSGARRPGPVSLTVGAAVLSVVLIAFALLTHAVGAPVVLPLALALGALAVRPVAVTVHRRRRRAGNRTARS